MAFALDPNQPQIQPGQPGQAAPVTTSSAPGAGPAAPGTQSTSAPSSQAPTQPFVNLQQYLTANAPQIQQEGQQLSDQLTAGATKAQGDITAAKAAFDSSVQGGYMAPNPDLVSEVASNPTAAASDPGKVKDFQAQLNNTYKGPQNFETAPGTVALNKEIEQASSAANLVNSPQGLQTYFQQVEPNPTPGMTTLDSVLLGGDPTAMGMVTQAAKPYKDVTQYLSDTTTAANKSVTDAQAAAQAAANNARAAIATPEQALISAISGNFDTNQKSYSGYNSSLDAIRAILGTPFGASLSADQESKLGITPGSFEQLEAINGAGNGLPTFNPLNPANFYLPPTSAVNAPSMAGSATPDQRAELAALEALTGGFNSPVTSADVAGVNSWASPSSFGGLDTATAQSEFTQNLQKALDAALANPSAYADDPNLMTQIQKIQDFLANINTKPPSYFAPPPQSPPLAPPIALPPGGGGHAAR